MSSDDTISSLQKNASDYEELATGVIKTYINPFINAIEQTNTTVNNKILPTVKLQLYALLDQSVIDR